jgi:predicted house-cleaning NTP pyrophosphatase (Maf/HAM1 superfamily)
MPSGFDESKVEARYYPNQGDYAVEIAYKKVLDIWEKIGESFSHPYIIIGADTVVSMDGKIFGKPGNSQTAIKYLQEWVD